MRWSFLAVALLFTTSITGHPVPSIPKPKNERERGEYAPAASLDQCYEGCGSPPSSVLKFRRAPMLPAQQQQQQQPQPQGRDRIAIGNLASSGARPSQAQAQGGGGGGGGDQRAPNALSNYSGHVGDRRYELQILQHPTTGAAFGTAPLSRLPLSPPLILQLKVFHGERPIKIDDDEAFFFIAHLRLLNEHAVPIQAPPSNPDLLYGSFVANLQQYLDQQGLRGYFFFFPDVSIREIGRYRLGVSLTRLQTDASNTHMTGGSAGILAQVVTDPFEVVQQPHYTAAPVTQLSTHFQQQGVHILRFPWHNRNQK